MIMSHQIENISKNKLFKKSRVEKYNNQNETRKALSG